MPKEDAIRHGIPLSARVVRIGKDIIIDTDTGLSSVYRYKTATMAEQAYTENIDAYKGEGYSVTHDRIVNKRGEKVWQSTGKGGRWDGKPE